MLRELDLPGDLETPCVVVDADVAEANLAEMASAMRERGVSLRPHVKTHSSAPVARMQLAAGAAGVTAGTIGMAEALARAGVRDVLIANTVWTGAAAKATRLRELHQAIDLTVGVDTAEGASALAAAVNGASRPLRVMIEVDSGEHRAGVRPSDAGELASSVREAGLQPVGAFTHGGHSYAGPGAAEPAAQDELKALEEAGQALVAAGVEEPVLSAGSTPTALLSARAPVTEERPGTYVFGDRQQVGLGGCRTDQVAIFAAATVVSTAVPGQVVLDSGAKTLAKDRPDWLEGHGELPAYPGAVVTKVFDYHAVVELPGGGPAPKLGEVVAVAPNHACAVVNLSDELLVLRAGKLVDRWPVDLRARS